MTEEQATDEEQTESIGTATMSEDGTIVLMLRAEDEESSTVGDAMFEYPTDHLQYGEILEHLGGLEVGETKQVPPWD